MKNNQFSKRDFLKNTALLSAGMMLSGASRSVMAKTSKNPIAADQVGRSAHGKIVGHGDFKYKVNFEWGNLHPHKTPVENSHGLAIDSKGRIIMCTDSDVNNFIVYNKDGKLIDAWGTQHPGAHAVKIVNENGEDVIYIVDSGWILNRHRTSNQWRGKWIKQTGFVSKLTIDGKLIYTLAHPVQQGIYEPGMAYNPTDIAIAPNGDLYVTDGYGSDFVIQYDSHGRYIRHWGGPKNSDPNYRLINSHGIEIDNRDPSDPHLLISSRQQKQLKAFSFDGQFRSVIDFPGAYIGGPVFKGDYFYAPVCWTDDNGRKLPNSGFITIVDKNNRVVANPGGAAPNYIDGKLQPMAGTYGVFNHCHSVCVDDEENIYVGQWNAHQAYPIKLERV